MALLARLSSGAAGDANTIRPAHIAASVDRRIRGVHVVDPPIDGFHAMEFDENGHLYLTGEGPTSPIAVLDADGTTIGRVPEVGARGLATSGSKLYVTLRGTNAVVEIDSRTLTEIRRWRLGDSVACPDSIAMVSHRVWFAYGCQYSRGGLGSIDLHTGHVRLFHRRWLPETTPTMRAVPGRDQILLQEQADGYASPIVLVYDITSGTPRATGRLSIPTAFEPLVVTPDGVGVLIPVSQGAQELRLADLITTVGEYVDDHPVDAIDVSADGGLVAIGGDDSVTVFHRGSGRPMRDIEVVPLLRVRALRFSPDGSHLFVVATRTELGADPVLFIYDLT
jgi:hypothetical protein